jgi:flagellar biosynthesis protein FliQ
MITLTSTQFNSDFLLYIPKKILFFVLSLFDIHHLSHDIYPFVVGIVALVFYLKVYDVLARLCARLFKLPPRSPRQ